MIVALGLFVALYQGDRILQYRPDPSVSAVYWFNATGRLTEGEATGNWGMEIDVSTFEKRTVVKQDDTHTLMLIETNETIVTLDFNGSPMSQFDSVIPASQLMKHDPITSLISFDLRGQVLSSKRLNRNQGYKSNLGVVVSDAVVLSPFPIGFLAEDSIWIAETHRKSDQNTDWITSKYLPKIMIVCEPQLPITDDTLKIAITVPVSEIGKSTIKGDGVATLRFSTGELDSLDLKFIQTEGEKKYEFRYIAKRVANYPKTDIAKLKQFQLTD